MSATKARSDRWNEMHAPANVFSVLCHPNPMTPDRWWHRTDLRERTGLRKDKVEYALTWLSERGLVVEQEVNSLRQWRLSPLGKDVRDLSMML